jgi:hypothetical protein
MSDAILEATDSKVGGSNPIASPPQDEPDFGITEEGSSESLLVIDSFPAPSVGHSATDRLKLWTVEEMSKLPPPEWLIDGLIELESLCLLFGPQKEGKSFLAIDWALSVATGVEWMGHTVKQGPVIYIAGEGGRGIYPRIAAWEREHSGVDLSAVCFSLQPVRLLNKADMSAFFTSLDSLNRKPSLVVIDTLSRAFVGGDENSTQQMSLLVEAADSIKRHTSGTVLLVHHTTKSRKDGQHRPPERGSSVLSGAVETMIRVAKDADDRLTISCEAQKNAEQFKDFYLDLVSREDPFGNVMKSAVLVRATKDAGNLLSGKYRAFLDCFPPGTSSAMTSGELQDSWCAATGLSNRTFHAVRHEGLRRKHVRMLGKGKYELTDLGSARAAMCNVTATATTVEPTSSAATATPP